VEIPRFVLARQSTKLWTVPAQLATYPQEHGLLKSCSSYRDTTEAHSRTCVNRMQVIDLKKENTLVHRKVLSLSTITMY
jgi:hypothetical protein